MLPYTFDNVVFEESPSDGGAILMHPPPYHANGQQKQPEAAHDVGRNEVTQDINSRMNKADGSTTLDDDKGGDTRQVAPSGKSSVLRQPKQFTTVVTIESNGKNDEQSQEHLSRSFMSNPF